MTVFTTVPPLAGLGLGGPSLRAESAVSVPPWVVDIAVEAIVYLIKKVIDRAFEDDDGRPPDDPIDLGQGVTIRPSAVEAVYAEPDKKGQDWHVYIRTSSGGVIEYPFDGNRSQARAREVAEDITKRIGGTSDVPRIAIGDDGPRVLPSGQDASRVNLFAGLPRLNLSD